MQNVTSVAVANWKAINLKCYYAKKIDGNKYTICKKQRSRETNNTEFANQFDVEINPKDYEIYQGDQICYLSDIKNKQEFGSELLDRRYRYIINTGSSRSSKTWSINQCLYRYATSYNYKHITILRDVAKHCRELVETEFLDWLRDPNQRVKELQKGIISNDEFSKIMHQESLLETLNRNKTEHTYETPSQSLIRFTGADDLDSIMGKSQNVLWINEPYRFNKDVFDQLDQRTSEFIIIDWNPKQKHFIDNLSRHERAFEIHSTYKKNPFCPPEQAAKIDSYEPTPYNIKNGTANEYLWQVMGLGIRAEMPNKIYSGWKECTLNEFNSLPFQSYFGIDWGLEAPTVIVECKYNGDGAFYFNELLYESERNMIYNIKTQLGENWNEILKAKDLGIVTYYIDKIGIEKETDLIVCDNNKPEKINELRMLNYWAVPAYKPPGSATSDEFSGISFLQRANIYVTSNSNNIWSEYDTYEWAFFKDMNLEKPIKRNDHAMDAMRYIATYLKKYLSIDI